MITTVASFFLEGVVMWVLVKPLAYLIELRKKAIIKGIELRGMQLNVHHNMYPILGMTFDIQNNSTANIKIHKLILVLQSGQWEFMRLIAIPEIDTSIPPVIRNRRPTQASIQFQPPLEWWAECRSNIAIKAAFLQGQTMWGAVNSLINVSKCSVNENELDNIGRRYLSRIRIRNEV